MEHKAEHMNSKQKKKEKRRNNCKVEHKNMWQKQWNNGKGRTQKHGAKTVE